MTSKTLSTLLSVAFLSASCGLVARAQDAPPPAPPAADGKTPAPIVRPDSRAGRNPQPRMARDTRDSRDGRLEGRGPNPGARIAPPGMWWKNPDVIQKLTLTEAQQKQMDDIFQKSRLQLIDLKANVEKQEVMLEPMLDANPPDTAKVLGQIERVAKTRSDLEIANARMLLGIRGVLTADQWTKLQAERGSRHMMFKGGGPGGPGMGRPDGHGETMLTPPNMPTDSPLASTRR